MTPRTETDWQNGIKHIDIWTGNANSGGDAQIQCEDDLTPSVKNSIVKSPADGLEVDCEL